MKTKIRQEVYNKCDGHCSYCGKKIEYKEMQVDHYYPKHFGLQFYKTFGLTIHDISNLLPSCRRCNHYKRAELPENFRKTMLTLHERLSKIYIFNVALDFGMVDMIPFTGIFYYEKLGITMPKLF